LNLRHSLLFLGLLAQWLTLSRATELSTDTFTIAFSPQGFPERCLRKTDGAELLKKGDGGEGFYLIGLDGAAERLSKLSADSETRLLATTADGSKEVVFQMSRGFRYIALRIASVKGIAPERFESLHFNIKGTSRLRVRGLDYMTRAGNRLGSSFVDWPEFWHHSAEDPLGGFVLYEKTSDEDEDETLLRLWVEQKLPHPRVAGEWTLERAHSWISEWQKRFADRTQLRAQRLLPPMWRERSWQDCSPLMGRTLSRETTRPCLGR